MGERGNFAKITKKTPECCRALFTPADTYDLAMTPGHGLNPHQKAMLMGEMTHLDYMWFEKDEFPLQCQQTEEGGLWCSCLLCLCYCYGALCPIKCCINIPP